MGTRLAPKSKLLLNSIVLGLLVLLMGACGGSDSKGDKGGKRNEAVAGTTPAAATTPVTIAPAGGQTAVVPTAVPTPAGPKPNILFVLTDDMRFDDMQFMPLTKAQVGDAGVTFDNEFDNVTLCCPARTSIIRGQYSHNTGVLTNDKANGGFEEAYKLKDEQATVGTAVHDSGYETGLFGKYLNGYPNTADNSYIPPGWEGWASSTKGNAYGEYNYTLNQNGKQVQYEKKPEDYGTTVYMGLAKSLINKANTDKKPFFIYLAVYAPHQPATPAPPDEQAFPGLKAPRDAAFNEAQVADKPQFIRALPMLSVKAQANIDNLYRKRAQSLQAVDRGVADLIAQLKANGQLDNTYIIFTSDNGFHLGQHRMPSGKQTAYETDIHLPLLIRGPGITGGTHVSAITGNIDLAPTIAALAQSSMKDNPDGRSLVPLFKGTAPSDWRQVYLLEHWVNTSTEPEDRGDAQLEPDDPDQGGVTPGDDTTEKRPAAAVNALRQIPEFQGLRVANYTYVEYVTGERELYDLTKDPDELTNLASTADANLISTLHQRLDELRKCAGDACRASENKPLNLPH